MSFRADEKWLQDYIARGGKVQASKPVNMNPVPDHGKGSKYGNQITESHGKRFDSKHEAKIYEELRLRCLSGEFIGIGCQVTFYLPGNIKYIADFVAFRPDFTYQVFDAKSEATRKDKVYRLKRRLMKECRHIDITEV